MFVRARKNAACNSGGKSSGNFCSGVASGAGVSDGAAGDGMGAGTCFGSIKNFGKLIFGVGTVISGFLVRIINAVVAM